MLIFVLYRCKMYKIVHNVRTVISGIIPNKTNFYSKNPRDLGFIGKIPGIFQPIRTVD